MKSEGGKARTFREQNGGFGLTRKTIGWYLDLRRFGVPNMRIWLGFERAIMYITGMTNIRDVIAFQNRTFFGILHIIGGISR